MLKKYIEQREENLPSIFEFCIRCCYFLPANEYTLSDYTVEQIRMNEKQVYFGNRNCIESTICLKFERNVKKIESKWGQTTALAVE